jgi:cell division inhibitor SepF
VAEERGEVRGLSRSGNVTRLVAALPGMVVVAAHRFEDAQEGADHLKTGRPVILHLEGLDHEVGQRIVNFLMGAAYALGGEMHRIGQIVLFVPAGVEVTIPLSLRMAEREGKPTNG